MRKLTTIIVASAASMTLALPSAFAQDNEELAEIQIGYQPNMGSGALVHVGISQGFFEREGLQADAVRFTDGPTLITALAAGEIDIGYVGPGATFQIMNGTATLLTWDNVHEGDYVLARADSGMTTPADLEGKSVLVPEGTSGEMILRLGLRSADLDYDDIEALASTPDAATAAFAAGEADAIGIWSPFADQLAEDGELVKLASNNPDDENFVSDVPFVGTYIANNEVVESNPGLVERSLRALAAANDYRLENLDEVVAGVASFTDVPEDVLRETLPVFRFASSDEIEETIRDGEFAGWMESLNEVLVEMGRIDSVVPVDDYFDAELTLAAYEGESEDAEQASDSGGISVVTIVAVVAIVVALAFGGFIIQRRRT